MSPGTTLHSGSLTSVRHSQKVLDLEPRPPSRSPGYLPVIPFLSFFKTVWAIDAEVGSVGKENQSLIVTSKSEEGS